MKERNGTGGKIYAFDGYSSLTPRHFAESGKEATECFYAEINSYDFKKLTYCHFTQVIWCETQKIGAGIAAGPSGIFMTFRYSPAAMRQMIWKEMFCQFEM